MKTKWTTGIVIATGILVAGILLLRAEDAVAHCDTTAGPIIPEARMALEAGDVTPVLKWVKTADDEEAIKAAFAKAVAVRVKGPETQELADQYFLETLIRLHRAGEGAPYTGIKDQAVEPIIAMTDKALAEGSADDLIQKISAHMAQAIQDKLANVVEARKNKDKSVEAGREFVEAYVVYTHYVEGIHNAIISSGAHHAENAGSEPKHKE